MAATARMPVPSDPKAPKFDGDDRDLLSFIEDYEEATDAAKLTPIQKVRRIVCYVSSDVCKEIEQYAEFNVDRTNPPADCWTDLKDRLNKEYMITETVRVYTKADWDTFIAANRARQITTEQELAKLACEVNCFSEGHIKPGSLSQEAVAQVFVTILENSLGQNLALGLQLARRTKQLAAGQKDDPTKPYTLQEVQEEAQRVIRSGTVGVGIVFKTAPVSAPALAIQTPAQPMVIKSEPTYQQLLACIQELEQHVGTGSAQGSAPVNSSTGPRAPRDSACFYCGGRHVINECADMQSDLAKGCCRQDGRRVVYPDGGYIAMNGKRLGERVAEFNAAHPEYEYNHAKQGGASVSAMLVEVGDAWFAEPIANEASIPEFETTEAEEAWWTLMTDSVMAYNARKAAEPRAGEREGLRSQTKAASGAGVTQGKDKGKTTAQYARDEPPHVGKQPVTGGRPSQAPKVPTQPAVVSEAEKRVVEGTPRVLPSLGVAQPARPQFRIQAPVEDEGLAKLVAERVMKAAVPLTMAEIVALCPSVRRHLRDQVTPKRVMVGYAGADREESSMDGGIADVWRYRVMEEEEIGSRDLIAAETALPLRYLDCWILRIEAEGVLDSGAQIVIVSKRLWQATGQALDESRQLTLEAANNTKNRTVGLLTNLPIVVGGITFYLQVYVFEDAPFDLLLGRPFYGLMCANETSDDTGASYISLSDPNLDRAVRLPTKARSPPRPARSVATTAAVSVLPHF